MEENTLMPMVNLRRVLAEYGETAAELYRMELLKAGRVASGALQDSVTARVVEGDTEWEVQLSLADYWKYVEGGTKGTEGRQYATYPAHVPPVSKIVEWIKIKPVLPRPTDLARKDGTPHRHRDGSEWTLDEIYTKMGWRVAMGIYKHGVEPVPALENTTLRTYDSFKAAIRTALRQDMQEVVRVNIIPMLQTL